MSWFLVTLLFVIACFVGAFSLSEWLINRRNAGRGGDRDSLV